MVFKVFENAMTSYDQFTDYGPKEWEKFDELYTAYISYLWGIIKCDTMIKTNTAKKLLEMVKTVEFDVIIQDICLYQCFYGLWEVSISDVYLV